MTKDPRIVAIEKLVNLVATEPAFTGYRIDRAVVEDFAVAFFTKNCTKLFDLGATYNPLQREVAQRLRQTLDDQAAAQAKQEQTKEANDRPSWLTEL